MLPAFSLERPDRLVDALALVDDECVPYAGGTELLMAMKLGVLRPRTLVDLKRIAELRRIEWEGDSLVIGASVTHAMLAADEALAKDLVVFVEVARSVGNARVRNQGTIGGNLCFNEPRSDVTTLLCALDGEVTLASAHSERDVPVAAFLVGAYETTREANELMVRVTIPAARRKRGVYVKHQYAERPTVGVAVVRNDEVGAWRVVVGAVGETPVVFDLASLDAIDAEAIAAQSDAAEDLSGSADYKEHLVGVYVRRAVEHARARLS